MYIGHLWHTPTKLLQLVWPTVPVLGRGVLSVFYGFHICLRVCWFVCASALIMCAIINVCTLLPCSFTSVDLTAALSDGVATILPWVVTSLRYQGAEATLFSFPGAQKEKRIIEEHLVSTVAQRGFLGFWGELGNYCDTNLCCMTVHYWITGVITFQNSPVCSTKLCCVPSVWLESQEWHWRTNNWWQYSMFVWQGRVRMATNGYSRYTCMSSYRLYLCLASTLERQKWHIGECNRTACTCANSGYQALLSNFF